MTTSKNLYNPYPGLRPFRLDEDKYFFGRKEQTGSIIEKLISNRFIALIGSSGSGKTSLINAGIIPEIIKSNVFAQSPWRIISAIPGESPIDNLSIAISESANSEKSKRDEKVQPGTIAQLLQNNSNGLTESLLHIQKDEKEKVLVVLDNFEDLSRYFENSDNSGIKRCETFTKLLVEAAKNKEIPVYIVISIRSGFLEKFDQIGLLSQIINESNLKLPQLGTEDLKKVIHGPAEVLKTEIEPELEKQLLRDITGKSYQLPLLQHVLSRMWDNRMKSKNDDPVSLKDYQAVGGIENTVSLSAEEAYMELPDNGKRLCEKLFKTITEKVSANIEVSRPLPVNEIALITRSSVPETIRVVEHFRKSGRSFLLPQEDVELTPDTVIGISHESLVKLWDRLQTWVEEEAESVATYKRIAEASRLYQMGKGELLSADELHAALLWKEKNEPSYQWAKRHNTAFERTIQYLNLSHESYEYNEYKKYVSSKRISKLTRALTVAAVIIVLSSAGLLFFNPAIFFGDDKEQTDTARDEGPAQNDAPDGSPSPAVSPPDQDNQTAMAEPAEPEPTPPPSPQTGNDQQPEYEDPTGQQPPPGGSATEDQAPETPAMEPPPVYVPPAEASRPDPEPSRPDNDQPATRDEIAEEPDETVLDEEIMERMEAASRSLAARSIEVENNPELKALLAFQSLMFNERYNGSSYVPEIFTGLISSVKHLYGENYNVFSGHNESVNSVIFRPNSTVFYTASSDGQILQWDINDTNKSSRTLLNNSVVNNLLAISPNAQWLAIATDGLGIQVINPARNQPLPVRIRWGNDRMAAMDFFPDNENILFAGSDNSLVKYNIRTNNHEVITVTDSEVLSLAISPDGNLIAAGTRSGELILLNNEPDPGLRIIHSESGNDLLALSFNHNGTRLAAGTVKGEIKILEIPTGSLLTTLGGHSARVADLEFSPDNTLLASTSFDGTIRLWNAQNLNSSPVVLREHGSWVQAVAFSSNGNYMVTGSRQEARLRAWTTNSRELASMICEKLTRNMTQTEWNQFIGEDIPYMESCPQLTDN